MKKPAQPQNPSRVAVFIDHSNVHHLICKNRIADPLWIKWYNPTKLAENLAGNRQLIKTFFYCSPPPPYLLSEGKKNQEQYWNQLTYYEEIKKLPNIELKYARLSGVKGDLEEKNLDTQLSADMFYNASLNLYDVAILVASDGDYVSPVDTVKKLGRKVELVYFRGSVSWDLRNICDISRRIRRNYLEELVFTKKLFLLNKTGGLRLPLLIIAEAMIRFCRGSITSKQLLVNTP